MSDVLLLSLGTTIGLRRGDETLAGLLRDAGASVQIAGVRIGAAKALRRAYPLTDLIEAAAARRALQGALARAKPRAVIFSSTTSSLLAGSLPLPYAVRLDAPCSLNRPGARNTLQHALERRQLRKARLVLPFSEAAASALPVGAAPAIVLPQPITQSGRHEQPRERVAIAYTPDPKAKGLDIVVAAWAQAELPDARLEVFGVTADRALRHLDRHRLTQPPGVIWRGRVGSYEFRAALRQAHAFLTGARWEDFGFAQLEALADGALLVCGATRGAFEALAYARELAPQLCAPDLEPASLAAALRRAFALTDEQARRYREAATQRLAAYRREAVSAVIANRVLPALLG
jgi:Glycosyl transferases group 1